MSSASTSLHLVVNVYTEATEGSPTDGGDNNARGFPLPTYYCVSFRSPQPFVNQSKVFVVSDVYQVVYHSNIPANRMAKWLEGNTESKVEGEAL